MKQMTDKKKLKNLEDELKAIRPAVRVQTGTLISEPWRGRCYICGCKVHRTEILCGECVCEDDVEEADND